MSIFKNSISCEQYIKPLGSVVMTAGPDTLFTLNLQSFGQVRKIAAVIAGASISGVAVLTWYGGSTTSGGTLTKIAALSMDIGNDEAVLQIDGEDMSEAAEKAGYGSDGFKSLVLKIDGTNADTVKATILAIPFHMREGLTPSDVSALT